MLSYIYFIHPFICGRNFFIRRYFIFVCSLAFPPIDGRQPDTLHTHIEEITITKKDIKGKKKTAENFKSPGIDRVQNFWI